MNNQIDYFDEIINDIRSEIDSFQSNDSVEFEFVKETPAITATGLVGRAVTQVAVNAAKFPIDPGVKKVIQKKVKLEMKIRKIKKENPKNKEAINELKTELKEVDKLYRMAVSIAKSDKTKDILMQYKKKCELDFGPRSIYYASIKVPELKTESVRNSLIEDLDLDFYIESEMEDLAMFVEDAINNSKVDANKPPENDDSGAAEATVNDTDKSSDKTENSIGAMLPQTGSTEGLGNPNDVVKDIAKVNKHSESNLNGIDLPDDIELESVKMFIFNPDHEYTFFVESEISKIANSIKLNVKLSAQEKKCAIDKAIAKRKLYVAKKTHRNRAEIDELKRKLIEAENKFRKSSSKLSKEQIDELNRLVDAMEKELDDKIITDELEHVKAVNDAMSDNTQKVEESYEPYDLKYPKDIVELKLEAAERDGNLDLITKYNNQLKYFNRNPDANVIVIREAANIDPEIQAVIDVLNNKGYTTKYSSAGHTHLRKKEDKERDGVYYDRLYSDARIMFAGDYKFPPAPKHWVWKKVDDKDYLDIVPAKYNPDKDGSPDKAFENWKAKYMETLRTWADNLPNRVKNDKDEVKTKDRKGRDITVESFEDIDNNSKFLYEMMMDDIFDSE